MMQKLSHQDVDRQTLSFVPHDFTSIVSKGPVVVLSRKAYEDMCLLVDECAIEIGWLGLVERTSSVFYISEIFVPKQACNEVRTRFEDNAIFDLVKELKSRNIEMSKLKFWGHSHVYNSPIPSNDDWRQIGAFGDSGWMLTAIANKFGKIRFQAHYYDYGVSIGDIPWMIEADPVTDESRLAMQSVIKKRVTILRKSPDEDSEEYIQNAKPL